MDLVGKEIGNYRITAKINSGSYGSVYRAEHIHLQERIVAIKLFHLRVLCKMVNVSKRPCSDKRPRGIEKSVSKPPTRPAHIDDWTRMQAVSREHTNNECTKQD